jgi:hypothetical protein
LSLAITEIKCLVLSTEINAEHGHIRGINKSFKEQSRNMVESSYNRRFAKATKVSKASAKIYCNRTHIECECETDGECPVSGACGKAQNDDGTIIIYRCCDSGKYLDYCTEQGPAAHCVYNEACSGALTCIGGHCQSSLSSTGGPCDEDVDCEENFCGLVSNVDATAYDRICVHPLKRSRCYGKVL